MAIRIECSIEDFGDTWVEVSDKWTRREYRDMLDAEGDAWLDLFHAKVEACHIQTDGEPITDPQELTEDMLDDVDMRVLGFLGGLFIDAAQALRSLGFMSGHVSSNGTGKMPKTEA